MKNKSFLLQTTHYKSLTSKGFTLLELLLTMAIIGILAGAILISLSAQRKKAQEAKALVELSGVMQPMLMCRSDGGEVNNPAANVDICKLSTNYGKWPSTGAGTGLSEFGNYSSGDDDGDGGQLGGNWFFSINDTNVIICCNSRSSRCKDLSTGPCNANTDLTN